MYILMIWLILFHRIYLVLCRAHIPIRISDFLRQIKINLENKARISARCFKPRKTSFLFKHFFFTKLQGACYFEFTCD